MFNRGKTNQESSKGIGWNGSSGRFRDPVGNRFHVCIEKREKRNGNKYRTSS